nr:MAG TPA: hypothetical protein [Caudoviricetes sp.]
MLVTFNKNLAVDLGIESAIIFSEIQNKVMKSQYKDIVMLDGFALAKMGLSELKAEVPFFTQWKFDKGYLGLDAQGLIKAVTINGVGYIGIKERGMM